MSRIIHFEIPAENLERASAFYKKAFGWKIEKWPGPVEYWMVTTGKEGQPGICELHQLSRTRHASGTVPHRQPASFRRDSQAAARTAQIALAAPGIGRLGPYGARRLACGVLCAVVRPLSWARRLVC